MQEYFAAFAQPQTSDENRPNREGAFLALAQFVWRRKTTPNSSRGTVHLSQEVFTETTSSTFEYVRNILDMLIDAHGRCDDDL